MKIAEKKEVNESFFARCFFKECEKSGGIRNRKRLNAEFAVVGVTENAEIPADGPLILLKVNPSTSIDASPPTYFRVARLMRKASMGAYWLSKQ